MKTKICARCGQRKIFKKFSYNKNRKDNLSFWCKRCYKNWTEENKEKLQLSQQKYYKENKEKILKKVKKYRKENRNKIIEKSRQYRFAHPEKIKNRRLKDDFGINLEKYNKILKTQNFKCAICGQCENTKSKQTNRFYYLSVDHDHKTGKVRGLLCANCNHLLGCGKDDITILKNAIKYLKRNKLTKE